MDPVPGFEQKLFHPPVGVCFDTPLEAKELRVWEGVEEREGGRGRETGRETETQRDGEGARETE